MSRRASHIDIAGTYSPVGASNDPNIVRFPPEGYITFQKDVYAGSGPSRFRLAVDDLMTWGAQRGAGIDVTDVTHGDQSGYQGVKFDEDGTPIAPQDSDESTYSAAGEPYIVADTEATLNWPRKSLRRPLLPTSRRVRVVYTIDEPNRQGFAIGTIDAEGVVGEEVFIVEHRADGTVWATVRGLLMAADSGKFGIKGLVLPRAAIVSAKAQLKSLALGGGKNDSGSLEIEGFETSGVGK